MRQTQKPRIVNLLMLTVAGMINTFYDTGQII